MRRLPRRVLLWLKDHYGIIQSAMPALLMAGVITIVFLAIRHSQTVTNARQHDQIAAGCQRLNLLEITANGNDYHSWRVFKVVLQESEAAVPPNAAASKATAAFLAPLRLAVAGYTWTPTLDCQRAVQTHGVRYVLPEPVPFNRRLPPASALTAH